MRVSVDARPLDDERLRGHGIGRYAQALLGALEPVAEARGDELVLLRGRRRIPLLLRGGAALHHTLSIYEAPLYTRVPLVVTLHDVVPLQWPEAYLRSGLRHRALYRAVRRAAAVICPSRAVCEDSLRHLELDAERVHAVPEAADERFAPSDDRAVRERLGLEGPYLLYLGALDDPRKDVPALVEAFGHWAADQGRRETLVLAGPGGAQLESRNGVLKAGLVPDEDLPGLLSGASCLVSASRYEGFGLPLLEALACGTPVAAYEAGAMRETAGPGALLVEPGDAAGLLAAAGLICDDAGLAERLAADGRTHAAGFSWRRTAELTWDVYELAARLRRPA